MSEFYKILNTSPRLDLQGGVDNLLTRGIIQV